MASHVQPHHHWLSSRSTIRISPEDGTERAGAESEIRPSGQLFACPYMKRDPHEYGETLSCSRSGWKTIHGLR